MIKWFIYQCYIFSRINRDKGSLAVFSTYVWFVVDMIFIWLSLLMLVSFFIDIPEDMDPAIPGYIVIAVLSLPVLRVNNIKNVIRNHRKYEIKMKYGFLLGVMSPLILFFVLGGVGILINKL